MKNKRSDINKSGTLDKKVEGNLIEEFKKWNNTFICDAEKGTPLLVYYSNLIQKNNFFQICKLDQILLYQTRLYF